MSERRTGTLYWLPVILDAADLDPTETLLLVALADHVNAEDECFVGISRLAARARVSYGTARRRLAALEERGVITRTIRRREDGGRSVYDYRLERDVLDPPAILRGGVRAPGRAEAPAHQGARTKPPLVNLPEGTTPPAPDGAAEEAPVLFAVEEPADDPVGFDEFWAVWPYHRGSKAEAKAAWRTATGKAEPAAIVAGAARYASDPNLPPPADARFVPHAAKWLRQERWNDGPLPARSSGPANRSRVTDDRDRPTGRLAL